MFDRSLLRKLSVGAHGLRLVDLRLGEKVLNLYLTQAVPYDDAKAGVAVAVQKTWRPQCRFLGLMGSRV